MNPAYDECSSYCGLQQEKLEGYCETCPARKQQNEFLKVLEDRLTEELEDGWKEYGIANLLTDVSTVKELESFQDDNRTVTTQTLIDVLIEERAKKERVEDYQHKLEIEGLT